MATRYSPGDFGSDIVPNWRVLIRADRPRSKDASRALPEPELGLYNFGMMGEWRRDYDHVTTGARSVCRQYTHGHQWSRTSACSWVTGLWRLDTLRQSHSRILVMSWMQLFAAVCMTAYIATEMQTLCIACVRLAFNNAILKNHCCAYYF